MARNQLHKDYILRNDAVHNHEQLPPEVKAVSEWLKHLERLIDKL